MATKIDLISNALILIGDAPINSLTGGSRAQQVGVNLYDTIVESELSKHYWGFARKKAQLSQVVGTPEDDEYSTIYQLPTDLLLFIKVKPSIKYQIYGDKLYCNYSGALYCDYIYSAPESSWPAYFVKMIEYALARDFATSIRDSSSSRQEMAAEYLNASRMARFSDSQQHPQETIHSNPFANVRY